MAAPRVSDRFATAFITGASTGLGRAFAEMLLAEGVRVWGTSRAPARLADLTQAHAPRFTPVALDLRDPAQLENTFRSADAAAGGFDLVINNAGFGVFAEFAAVDFAVWRDQIDVMLTQPARLSHLALRGQLARNRGALVNISSLAAEFPLPFQSAYNIAKAGLTALNESLMIETAPTAVAVIDFRPGDYRTDFDGSLQRPQAQPDARQERAWHAFRAMMQSGPPPAHAAAALRRALLRGRSGTVRTGRFFQAVIAPLIARFGSLPLKRRIQARYFDLS
ncbi:SDR family NAD(P)-dependent oxidoreductase [Horticoccus sp. 23ND18S-11]|uniref:SDR family NAD(P)-dependent oxidoreductase n=1 Tax=Horticoccus sp. 23ND18S-11 TaxID=3391832 RepID=UPI0039C9B76C